MATGANHERAIHRAGQPGERGRRPRCHERPVSVSRDLERELVIGETMAARENEPGRRGRLRDREPARWSEPPELAKCPRRRTRERSIPEPLHLAPATIHGCRDADRVLVDE